MVNDSEDLDATPADGGSSPDPGHTGPAAFQRSADVYVSAQPKLDDGMTHAPGSLEVEEGAEVVFSWSCDGATGVRIEPPGLEQSGASGSYTCAASGITTYCFTALDGDGTALGEAEVLVSTHDPDACVSPHAGVNPPVTGAASGSSHIFDATALTWWSDSLCNLAATKQDAARIKNLSLTYGLRMYKALLGWELTETSLGSGEYSGCVYSVDPPVPDIYNQLRKDFIKDDKGHVYNEWPGSFPAMPDSVGSVTAGGASYTTMVAFGLRWVLSGATNCSCSQLAALLAAQPDGKLCVRKTAGADPVIYDVFDETTVSIPLDNPTKKKKSVSAVRLFENSFVQVDQITVGKVTTWSQEGKGPYEAMQLLGIGTYLGTGALSNDETNMRLGRLGDACSSKGHAFMVGDMIYVVEFEPATPKHKGEKMIVLQSSFAKGNGELLPYKDIDSIKYIDKSLTAEDCDKLIADQQTFLDKVDAFLNVQPGDTLPFDDHARTVRSITCDRVVQFSANTRLKAPKVTVAGKFVDAHGKLDAELTQQYAWLNGISRARAIRKDAVVFARFYDHSPG